MEHKYDIPVLLDTIDSYIAPLRQNVQWGYDIPMFICGTEGAHVDNIEYLNRQVKVGYEALYGIIGSMEPEKRKRYGVNYAKSDFTELEKAYKTYKEK